MEYITVSCKRNATMARLVSFIVTEFSSFGKDPNVPVTEYSMYFNSDKISD